MIKDKNYINIYKWMIEDLNLSGTDVIVYAMIYGFKDKEFKGTVSYIQQWTGVSKNTLYKVLKSLVDKGLLTKREIYKKGNKFCTYKIKETDTNFIKQYVLGKYSKTYTIEQMLEYKRFSNKEINYIKTLKYKKFLNTPYWKIISKHIKDNADNHCALCNSTKQLNVHHRTYEHHGDELHHINDIVCICKQCHQKVHNIKK